MGRVVVTAMLVGDDSGRDYEFLVDTGATHIGLPAEEIRALGLARIPHGRTRLLTATGVVEQDTFSAIGRLRGRGFVATVTQASVPLIGYELLENLRLRVNPVTRELEDVPDGQLAPPYQLMGLPHARGASRLIHHSVEFVPV